MHHIMQISLSIIHHAKSPVVQLHLSCVTSNLGAVAFYQKHGFKIYGTEPRALKIGNTFFDEHLIILLEFDALNRNFQESWLGCFSRCQSQEEKYLEIGMDDFVSKPMGQKVLKEVVKRVTDY